MIFVDIYAIHIFLVRIYFECCQIVHEAFISDDRRMKRGSGQYQADRHARNGRIRYERRLHSYLLHKMAYAAGTKVRVCRADAILNLLADTENDLVHLRGWRICTYILRTPIVRR